MNLTSDIGESGSDFGALTAHVAYRAVPILLAYVFVNFIVGQFIQQRRIMLRLAIFLPFLLLLGLLVVSVIVRASELVK